MRLPLNGPSFMGVEGDPVDALLECHERIRRFSTLAVKLASTPEAPDDAVKDAAARIHRYFAIALPLHVQDEDVSLTGRVWPVAEPSLRVVLDELARQHDQIEHRLSSLLPAWREISTTADPLLRASTAESAAGLATLLEDHLQIEEKSVLPRVRVLLPADVRSELMSEMRQRRSVVA